MIPVVAQTVACLLRAAQREGVGDRRGDDGDLRLGDVGLDAEALDHRVQLRRLLRRDLLGAHRAQRELVGAEELEGEEGAAADQRDRAARAGEEHAPKKTT